MSAEQPARATWEHGSFPPWPEVGGPVAHADPWTAGASWFATARMALRAIVELGCADRGWQRLRVPGFYCHDVFPSLAEVIELVPYEWVPGSSPTALDSRPGDAVLVYSYVGCAFEPPAVDGSVDVIEDHSHDPWSRWAGESSASWCVASLRKPLPLPDGAVVWSPLGAPVPTPVLPPLVEPVELIAEAMRRRAAYFAGGDGAEKATARRLHVEGEGALVAAGPAAMSHTSRVLFDQLDVEHHRRRRAENWRTLADALGGTSVAVLPASDAAAPLVVTLVLDQPARRDHLRQALIARDVYPSVLWPLGPDVTASADELDLSERVLNLHCDARYDGSDMRRVAELVGAAMDEMSR